MNQQRVFPLLKRNINNLRLQRVAGERRKTYGLLFITPDTHAAAGGNLEGIIACLRRMQRHTQPALAVGGYVLHAGEGDGIAGSGPGNGRRRKGTRW